MISQVPAYAVEQWEEWEIAYHEISNQNDTRALAMLQDRYASLPPGVGKLYVSSKLHSFMSLHGQPFHGNSLEYDDGYSMREQLFVSALNAEINLDFEAAKTSYIQLLKRASQTEDIQGKILFEYHLCRALNKQGQFFSASFFCSALRTHIEDTAYTILPKHQAIRVIANNLEYTGDYRSALESYQQYLAIIPSNVDPSGVYNDAGLLFSHLGQTEQALDYLNTALKIRSENNSPLELAQSHHSIGKVYLTDAQYDQSIHHFTQSEKILADYKHVYGLTYAYLGLGEAHVRMGKADIGIQYLLKSLEYASVQGNDQLRGEIYLALASSHLFDGNYTHAEDFAVKAHHLAEQIQSHPLETASLKMLADLAESQKDYRTALNFYQRYTNEKLSTLSKQQKSAYLALSSTQKEFKRQTANNDALEQNRNQAKTISLLDSLNGFYLLLISLLCLAIIALTLISKRKERRAELDQLTGARNRAAAIRDIRAIPKLTNSEHKHLLILLDLDDFKKVNDAYGHPTGDRALSHVAVAISEHLQAEDIFGRLGGEEFVILIREIDELDVTDKLSRIHNAISQTSFESESRERLNVTASLSYLSTSKSLADFDELYSILDQALYQAKQNGKNCIIDAFNDPIYLPPTAYVPVQP
ncbi:diguanylate cyclase [Vibrio sp. RE86]|uniref:diguanylate cyclase n=1 Tax=Vibrio sp. RE86 TaxID=2607605 RepID=UPI0034635355